MAGLNVVVDMRPDTDSFLPRYLTVQLLRFLAKALPTPSYNQIQYSDAAATFIAARKSPELFTPLTYSIFWRENPTQLLETYTESLDEVDKHIHTALTIALTNEDFDLASKLIDKGANVFLEDKLVLEIALTSIIQRDPSAVQAILAAAGPDDTDWVKEYFRLFTQLRGGPPGTKTNSDA